jgi:hypothetical protein
MAEGPQNFFQAQECSALRLFVGMLASDWKERICKCRDTRCGQYFLHPKPRQRYHGGTFCCRSHAKRTAAAKCMWATRNEGREELMEEAGRILSEIGGGPNWVANAQVKSKVAQKLCMIIARRRGLKRYHDEVKVNWVSLHRTVIEQKRLEFARQLQRPSAAPSRAR